MPKSKKKVDKAKEVHHVIIVDKSSSMQSIAEVTLRGINEQIDAIKMGDKKQKQFVTFATFNQEYQQVLFKQPCESLNKLTSNDYRPMGSTALNDAIGKTVSALQAELNGNDNASVLVTIFTDGQENSSKEYTQPAVKKLLEEVQGKGWAVTYVGANHDVTHICDNYSIPYSNAMAYTSDHVGTSIAFAGITRARTGYMNRAMSGPGGQSMNSNLFSQDNTVTDLTFENAAKLSTADIYGNKTDDFEEPVMAKPKKDKS